MKSIFRLLAAVPLMLISALAGAYPPVPPTDPVIAAQVREHQAHMTEATDLLREAKLAIHKSEMDSALTLLQQSLSLNPQEEDARLLLAYIYIQKGQPENIIATLGPMVYPPENIGYSMGSEITTQMIYTLALLERNAWPDAVDCYQKSRQYRIMKWHLPGGGLERAWPNPKFSADSPDYAGLRAYAHLVLGTDFPAFMEEKDQIPFMLEHLHQLLQTNPNSFDAALASGCLYTKRWHFTEARAAIAYAAQLASPSMRRDIKAALQELRNTEEKKRQYDARVSASPATPK